jgi:hypothetical protein
MNELVFKQASPWKKSWELCSGEDAIATVAITGRWSWRTAEAKIGEKQYAFRYKGWRNRLYISDSLGTQIGETNPRSFWNSIYDLVLLGKHYTLSRKGGCSIATDDAGIDTVSIRPRTWRTPSTAIVQDETDEAELLLALLLFYRAEYMRMNNTMAAISAANVAVISSN